MKYDLIIIGGGPAGLTAAIYAARYKLKTLVFSKNMGGVASTSPKICNYPSYDSISGYELMQKFTEHAKILGVEIIYEEVNKIVQDKKEFLVKTEKKDYSASKVIYAAGTKRERLNIPGEGKFQGRGVSYCTTCDGVFFKNKDVIVIGGGDAAMSSALLLSEFAKKVMVVYRGKEFAKGDPSWIEMIHANKKIEIKFNEEIIEIIGDTKVQGIKLKSGKIINCNGIFIEIGASPDNSSIKDLNVNLDKKGYVIVDKDKKTNIHGFYAIGDVTNNNVKQVITSAADGAIAVYNLYWELKEEISKEVNVKK